MGPQLTQANIAACANTLGLQFPKAYVRFLLAQNGGVPTPAYLPLPGIDGIMIERFLSIGDGGLADVCLHLRESHGLPDHLIPIVATSENDSFVLLSCREADSGKLVSWDEIESGFEYDEDGFGNAKDFYGSIDTLFTLFGPAKDRIDFPGLFCKLYYSSTDPRHGPPLARKLVAAGYDINYVLPSLRHPIFGSIDGEEFGVAEVLLELGTSLTHRDPLHENATIGERLADAETNWKMMLDTTTQNKYRPGMDMAKRKLKKIEGAMLAMARVSDRMG